MPPRRAQTLALATTGLSYQASAPYTSHHPGSIKDYRKQLMLDLTIDDVRPRDMRQGVAHGFRLGMLRVVKPVWAVGIKRLLRPSLDVLELVAAGRTTQEIMQQLDIGQKAVKDAIAAPVHTLGLPNAVGAITLAHLTGQLPRRRQGKA